MVRRWLLWLLALAFLWTLISRFGQLEEFVEALTRGQWRWVLAAAALQALYYSGNALLYHFSFETVGVRTRWRAVLKVLFAALFMNTVAPTGGLAGGACSSMTSPGAVSLQPARPPASCSPGSLTPADLPRCCSQGSCISICAAT